MSWQDKIEARTKAQAKYDKAHCVRMSLKLNVETDADIIRWLNEQRSKQGAIKQAIRDKINWFDRY